MIKAKKGFLLRRLGAEYMVVAIGEASRNFNGMIRMNETGAFYWKELEKAPPRTLWSKRRRSASRTWMRIRHAGTYMRSCSPSR